VVALIGTVLADLTAYLVLMRVAAGRQIAIAGGLIAVGGRLVAVGAGLVALRARLIAVRHGLIDVGERLLVVGERPLCLDGFPGGDAVLLVSVDRPVRGFHGLIA